MYVTYICVVVFCFFFYSVCFHKHSPDFISILESMVLNSCVGFSFLPCRNLSNRSLVALRLLQFPTLLNGSAQPHNLMADRLCGEFIFYIYCWAFWQMKSRLDPISSRVYWKSSLFSAVPFTVVSASGSFEERRSVKGVRGLVISLN